jgi:hypothetical protein
MPIHRGRDSHGTYYQWGHAAKYYYTPGDKISRVLAKQKARTQMIAIKRRQNSS